jgi:hypothetical protein
MRTLSASLLILLALTGCGTTLVFKVPEAPTLADALPVEEHDERVECEFMTVLINYSRHGMGLSPDDVRIAAKVANAMAEEFESYGTRITDQKDDAYWSVMILASNNERQDGYIFSALLASRNMSEGYDPGVAIYGQDEADELDINTVPSIYNGLSYGPYVDMEDQAREYVRRAYAAVFPTAKQLCDFEEADRAREQEMEQQLPSPPEPL